MIEEKYIELKINNKGWLHNNQLQICVCCKNLFNIELLYSTSNKYFCEVCFQLHGNNYGLSNFYLPLSKGIKI